ncbi:PQQ-binding-like beta-propeller repeat protein [Dactylosporangium sp. NPDC050588]|uniref:outer membrane protein assembly factor BamB family protein n=1 Tax=Dactylosporangium sp. NPDC050588 TaxID=3157211 RepID=UPI00340ADBBD
MAETVIELDLSSPWEPPEVPAPPRRRLRTRLVAVCVVLVAALGSLGAAGPGTRLTPLYRIGDQVRSGTVFGDLLFVDRFQQSVSDPRIEAHRRSDGARLWDFPTTPQQQPASVSAGALILMRYSDTDNGFSTTLTVVDSATGRQLWSRQNASLIGTRDNLVIVEQQPEQRRIVVFTPEEQQQPDPRVNHAWDGPPRHVLVLDERTGATVWEHQAPPRAALDYTWEGRYPTGRVTGVNQLDPSGLVTHRDIRTGAVLSTMRLAWSGVPAMFTTGASWQFAPDAVPHRALVYPDGERGAIVFDLADGRALFRTDASRYDGLYPCAADLFCATDDRGLVTFDSTTGAPRWRLGPYREVIGGAGGRLLVSTLEQATGDAPPLAVVDARTGKIVMDLAGWRLIREVSPQRLLLWRPLDQRTAVLGQLDPRTGRITVFGRSADWYGPPSCSADGDTLACVMVGELTVWRLPPRPDTDG